MTDTRHYTSEQLRRAIDDVYASSLNTSLLAWSAAQRLQDDLEREDEIEPGGGGDRVAAQAEFDGKILKVTAWDVLPRMNTIQASLLRLYWMGGVVQSIRKLKVPVAFDRALCIIEVHAPQGAGWDVDNRSIHFIINALRVAKVVPGDEWDKLSLLLLGGESDKENSRTEITVMKHPKNIVELLAGTVQEIE